MKLRDKKELMEYFGKNKIKVVALDLDRTTLRSDSTLSHRTKAAIESVIAAGIEVVVISGRPRCSLPEAILEIPGIRYLVTSNGAAVNLRDSKEERIAAWTLAPLSVRGILNLTLPYYKNEQITYETFVEGIAHAPRDYVNQPTKYGVPERAIPYVQNTRIPVADFPAFIMEHSHELDSFDLIFADTSCFQELHDLISKHVSDIYMTSSMERMLEVSHKNGGKASGLRFVLEQLQLGPEHAMAFGDGHNDADMLAFAGLGVAMANAMPLCLASADYVAKSNDEDGVAEILECLI